MHTLRNWFVLLCLVGLVTACTVVAADTAENGHQAEGSASVQTQAESQTEVAPEPQLEAEAAEPILQPDLPAGTPLLLNVARDFSLHLIDPLTGADIEGYQPLPLDGYSTGFVWSPQRDKMALVTSPPAIECSPGGCRVAGSALYLIDPATWTEQRLELAGSTRVMGYSAGVLAFNPAGDALAVTYAGPGPADAASAGAYWLGLVDPAGPGVGPAIPLDITPRFLAYTADGESLLLYGVPYSLDQSQSQVIEKPGVPQLLLFRADDLSLLWQTELAGLGDGVTWANISTDPVGEMWRPGLAFAADRGLFYIVHAETEQLTTVNVPARTLETVAIQAPQTWLDRLLEGTADVVYAKMVRGVTREVILSADKSRLYVLTTHHEAEESPPTTSVLQVIDPHTGTIMAERETEAFELAYRPEQDQLYLQRDNADSIWTDIVDGSRLAAVTDRLPQRVMPATLLDGSPILLATVYGATTTNLATLDPESFEAIQSWEAKDYAYWLTAR